MNTLTRVALAGAFAIGLGATAQAQTFAPSPIVPKLGNSQPGNPVATDGTPLPYNNAASGVLLQTGRSAYVGPVGGGVVGAGVGTAGTIVGTGLGVAGDALTTGFDAVGGVVNGGVDTVGGIVR